ncbi:hypothetical protein BJV82DRAFT_674604 [Fennellomyces sp. T-0311]|nr:hypothetical protein BJV82DRAFT_674604 [Fennellomyces sp. T-0311]
MSEQNPVPNNVRQNTQLQAIQSVNQPEQPTPVQPIDQSQQAAGQIAGHPHAVPVNPVCRSMPSTIIYCPRRTGPNNKRYMLTPTKSHIRSVIMSLRDMDEMEIEAVEGRIQSLANIVVKQLAKELGNGEATYAVSWTSIDDDPKNAVVDDFSRLVQLKTGVPFPSCEQEWCVTHVLSEHWDNKHFYQFGNRATRRPGTAVQNGGPNNKRGSEGALLRQESTYAGENAIICNGAAITTQDETPDENLSPSFAEVHETAATPIRALEQQASTSSHITTPEPIGSMIVSAPGTSRASPEQASSEPVI